MANGKTYKRGSNIQLKTHSENATGS